MTTRCFKGDYCQDEDPQNTENREISLYLIFIAEAVILASAVLLFHVCISHRRKMKAIRRTLKTYLEKKLEELVEMIYKDDGKKNLEFGKSHSQSLTGEPTSAESEMQTGT
ncbi:izumo sperm-egg fusion protein 3 isoform X2 [Mus pahari]|nr:izumo sperm-egg fusion protein 3 isoform X2 [Mus pahari]